MKSLIDVIRHWTFIRPAYQLERHSKSYARALLDADKFDSVEMIPFKLQDLFAFPLAEVRY